MYIKKEFDFEDLKQDCWSGAINTLETIEQNGKEQDLIDLLEITFDEYIEEIPTMTEVNDFLWFEDEYIFEQLDIEQ